MFKKVCVYFMSLFQIKRPGLNLRASFLRFAVYIKISSKHNALKFNIYFHFFTVRTVIRIIPNPKILTEMSDSKIRAGLIRYLMKEGYDGRFIHELLQKWKSENVSVKDGLIKLMEDYKKTQNSITTQNSFTSHHYQA
jgi:hypothetical protein